MHVAAKQNDIELVTALLSAGHNPYERTTSDVKSKKSYLPFIGKQKFAANSTAVDIARISGHSEMMKLLVSQVRG